MNCISMSIPSGEFSRVSDLNFILNCNPIQNILQALQLKPNEVKMKSRRPTERTKPARHGCWIPLEAFQQPCWKMPPGIWANRQDLFFVSFKSIFESHPWTLPAGSTLQPVPQICHFSSFETGTESPSSEPWAPSFPTWAPAASFVLVPCTHPVGGGFWDRWRPVRATRLSFHLVMKIKRRPRGHGF